MLRRAGALIEANAAELRDWVIRETGAVPGLADFAVGVATQECYEAAALASPSARARSCRATSRGSACCAGCRSAWSA